MLAVKRRPPTKDTAQSMSNSPRVRSLQDLFLLQRVTLEDLNSKTDRLLVLEDRRLAELVRSTEIAWEQIESSDEFRYGPAGRGVADDH